MFLLQFQIIESHGAHIAKVENERTKTNLAIAEKKSNSFLEKGDNTRIA